MEQPKKNLKKTGVRASTEVNAGKSFQPTGKVVAATGEDVPYTALNLEGRERRKKAGFNNSETEGIKVDSEGNSTPKSFSHKYVRTPNGSLKIIGADGSTIAEGREKSGAMQEALKKSEKKVLVTNSQRNRNARGNNVYGGSATKITDKEVGGLESDKQAVPGGPIKKNLQRVIDNENRDRAAINSKDSDKVVVTKKSFIKKPSA
jgi:hypothetical protein